MANIVIAPERTTLSISGQNSDPITIRSEPKIVQKVSVTKNLHNLVSSKKEVVRIEIPALQGVPGPQGVPGTFENLSESSLAFFQAKSMPIRDIYYQGDYISRIDFLNETEELKFFQNFVFDGELLAQIILNRTEDDRVFYKTLHYEDDKLIKISIE